MATDRSQVYQCGVCGNITEVMHASSGTLACCNAPMSLLAENTTDAAQEKHVPVVGEADGGVEVKVGSVAHPMDADHYIEWIEVISAGRACRAYLSPGDAPQATFRNTTQGATARAYCNLHGHWKSS